LRSEESLTFYVNDYTVRIHACISVDSEYTAHAEDL